MPAFKTNSLLLVLLFVATSMFGQKGISENTLRLRSGTKELTANASSFFQQSPQSRKNNEEALLLRYLQFFQIPTVSQQKALADHGIQCLQYLSNRTYIASIPHDLQLPRDLQELIRCIEPISPTDKISPALTNDLEASYDKKYNFTFTIQYFKTYSASQVLAILQKQQITIIEHQPEVQAITVATSNDRLTEIAEWPMISNIEPTITDVSPEDESGHSHHRSNLLNSSWNPAMHFNGEGVRIAIGEDGFIGPHIDLQNRIKQADLVGDKTGIHGEMVAGILAGAGNLNPLNKGIADGAELYVLREFEAVKQATNLHLEQGIVITNTAYSDGCNRGYTTLAQLADKQSHDYPSLIHVFSAGNAGMDDCEYGAGEGWGTITGGVKAGKNVLAVANLNVDGERVLSSSRGPSNDGRIKPDIAAFGEGQTGLAPNNDYQIGTGTSAAAPVISGVLAQLYQAYREFNNNANPSSALLKACLLNSADDLGNPGPDYSFGWGKVNAFKAYKILDNNNWLSGIAVQNSEEAFSIDIPEGLSQLRVMIYWHDKEGSPTNFKSLVNDIDLRVESPNQDVFLPWVLNPSPDESLLDMPAIKGIDHINNMEQVSIDNPSAGVYTFHVEGTEIPLGSQDYYIVYQFDMEELSLSYPNGGESFAPGESIFIHWDAFDNSNLTNNPFVLQYSTDDGNTWESIGTVDGQLRQSTWTIPDIESGDVLISVSRNNKVAQSAYSFSIYSAPTDLAIEQVCPTYVRLNWEPVDGAAAYTIYQLGESHMDSIMVSTEPTVDIAIPNPESYYWFAVSALSENGAKSRRSVAIPSELGLINCTPDHDIALVAITSPAASSISDCFSQPLSVSINIKNTGSILQSNFPIYYQYNNEPVVQGFLNGSIPSNVTINYTFDVPITSGTIGIQKLKVWTGLSTDEAVYNDTLSFNFTVVSNIANTLPFFENFDQFQSCSSDAHCATSCLLEGDWQNNSNMMHDDIDWRVHQGHTPSFGTGPETDQNTGVANGKYLYLEGGSGCYDQLALLTSPCIDLGNAATPTLTFWYHMYGTNTGSLSVDLFDGTTWHSNISSTIVGNQGSAWQKANINLEAFANQLVVLRFRGQTGDNFLTDIAIDNIAIYDANTPPIADFIVDMVRSCTEEAIRFQDNSFNEGLTWEWSFTPATVSFLENTNAQSEKPVIQFEETGLYSVSMTVTNSFGSSVKEKIDYILISNGMSLPYLQQFEGNNFPPLNWSVRNTDNDISWSPSTVIGKDGMESKAVYMNNFSYNKTDEEDVLRSPIIELNNVATPLLRFDYAYVSYSNNFADGLAVILSADCGNTFDFTLFEKSGNELATASNQNKAWAPQNSLHWKTAIIDLSAFVGQSVSLRFINTCQFGNNLYLDNVAVYEAGDFPVTSFEINPQVNTICVGESLEFTNTSIGNNIINYNWYFGNNNNPPSAQVSGPHNVIFQEVGDQAITLVASNSLGSDVNTQFVQVIDEPVVSFSSQSIEGGVQFWDNTLFGESYLWDFGDGQSSTNTNPEHVYNNYGTYEVTLTVNNACGTNSISQNIEVISSTYTPALPFDLSIFPNPAEDWFFLETRNNITSAVNIKIFDVAGKSYHQESIPLSVGIQRHVLDVSQFPSGLYLVHCQVEGQYFTKKLAVY